jgi:ATP-binding cassette subfamily F protein uup
LLLGKIKPSSGNISYGVNLEISYFDQLRVVLNMEKSAWENVAEDGRDTVFINGSPRHVISYLQDFLFATNQIRSPVKSLSGGERNRLMLAKMFTKPANVIVFDEPTNDLDAETLDLLEELLADFKGTVLVVSHDREFLNNVVTSMLVFEGDGRFKEYVGGYDDWQRQISLKEAQKPAPKTIKPQLVQKRNAEQSLKKRSFKENKELKEMPDSIEALEKERSAIHNQMSDINYFSKPGFILNAKERIKVIELELVSRYERWQELDLKSE